MTTTPQMRQSSAEFSTTFSPEGIPEPSDDEINRAYNIFDAEKMKYYRGVFVKLNRDFTSRKGSSPSEWKDFSEVIKLCSANRFDMPCYIKWCFLNRLVPKSKGKALSDVSYLRNVPQIMAYAEDRDGIERLYRVYRSIQKTIMLVKRLSKEDGCTAKETIRKIMSSGKLSTYVSTGTVSPFFVSLIPNSGPLVHRLMDRGSEDRVVLIDLCNCIPEYSRTATKAMSTFYPNAMAKTVVELCA